MCLECHNPVSVDGFYAAAITMGLLKAPGKGDTITYVGSMIALIVVGLVGLLLHVDTDLARQGVILPERFMRGAPFLAPMLFADMGALGLIALWPLGERVFHIWPLGRRTGDE